MALKRDKDETYADKDVVTGDGKSGICDDMNFTMAEAYKMLRTKMNLVIPQGMVAENKQETDKNHTCKIIGITSALRGEGKSTTAINLAYTIAQTGHKVLLVEGDMRLPNLARRLNLKEENGLSNILAGHSGLQGALKKHTTKSGVTFFVMTSGDIPPRPSELLESDTMNSFIRFLRKNFEYVIFDLPPVTMVTDALSVSPKLDGMLLVVRQGYCDKISLRDALYQFELAGTHVLGVVYNCSDGPGGRGIYYRNSRKYYRRKRSMDYKK